MFASGMTESSSKRITVDVVFSKEDFIMFYAWMHPHTGRCVSVTPSNVFQLFTLAVYYQVELLRMQCAQTLGRMPPSVNLLLHARRHGLDDLRDRVAKAIAEDIGKFDLRPLSDFPDVMMDLLLRLQQRLASTPAASTTSV